MKLFDLFYMGGPTFMSIVTICAIVMLVFSVKKTLQYFVHKRMKKQGLNLILLFGSLAMVLGFLGQAVGLVSAFDAIQQAGDISPSLVAGGLQVSMLAPMYGTIVFIFSLIIWGFLREIYVRKIEA